MMYKCDECGNLFEEPTNGVKADGLVLNGCFRCGCGQYTKIIYEWENQFKRWWGRPYNYGCDITWKGPPKAEEFVKLAFYAGWEAKEKEGNKWKYEEHAARM